MTDLVNFGRQWFEDSVNVLIEWFQSGLSDGYNALTEGMFGTPVPETGDSFVFGHPVNAPWVNLYDALVAGEIMLLALLLLAICVQGRHTIRIFDIGSSYEARKTRRSAWTGAFLIVTWYWVAVLCLYLINGFTIALIPGIDVLSSVMLEFLDISITNPALSLLMTVVGGVAMWVLQALLFIREILLYIYLYGMPIGIAVAFGGIPVVSRIAKATCLKFVPLAILPLPVAILFKGYELLFAHGTNAAVAPSSAFLSYLVAVSLPVLSVVIIWKLFAYASPITAKLIGGATKATVGLGAVAGAAYAAGPSVAATTARWGPRAAVGHAAAQRFSDRWGDSASDGDTVSSSGGGDRGRTAQDNVVTDAYGQQGVPEYRRTENDPGYY